MTEVTTISVATPSAMPTSEKIGDDGDEPLAFAGAQIAAGDRAFEGAEHRCDQARWFGDLLPPAAQAAIRRELVQRVVGREFHACPPWRRFSSTLPAAAPRGPTTICQG